MSARAKAVLEALALCFSSCFSLALAGFAAVCYKYVTSLGSLIHRHQSKISYTIRELRTTRKCCFRKGTASHGFSIGLTKALPLYPRAEELFRAKGNTRNEIYARVGRIRAQSETMSWTDVSNVLGQQLELPIVKTDMPLRL